VRWRRTEATGSGQRRQGDLEAKAAPRRGGVLERRDRERRGFPARPREARPDSLVLSHGFGRDNGLASAILFRAEKVGLEVFYLGIRPGSSRVTGLPKEAARHAATRVQPCRATLTDPWIGWAFPIARARLPRKTKAECRLPSTIISPRWSNPPQQLARNESSARGSRAAPFRPFPPAGYGALSLTHTHLTGVVA
jgi:hypothetical protein